MSFGRIVRGMGPAVVILGLVGGCTERLRKTRVQDVDSVVHYPASGGVLFSASRNPGKKVVCVAPPAQGVMNLDLDLKHDGKVNVAGYVEVETENALAVTRTLATLYEQTERTLFLQFTLYRLCEAYANGMLDEETYAEGMAREALALKRAADEAAARRDKAQEDDKTAQADKSAAQTVHEDGIKALVTAQERLTTAQSDLRKLEAVPTESAVDARPAELAAATRRLGEAKRKVNLAAADVAAAKQTLASEAWKAADRAVRRAAETAAALAAAKADADAFAASYAYASKLAGDALTAEDALKADALNRDVPAHEVRSRLSRRNYERMFERVLTTAETLGKQQVEIARAEAEKAKSEAEASKAKAEEAKAKAGEESKRVQAKLDALQGELVEAAVRRAGACGEKCGSASGGADRQPETVKK